MKITDSSVFLNQEKFLKIPLINGTEKRVRIPLNMPVGSYCRIMANIDKLQHSENEKQQINYFVAVTTEFLKLHDKRINSDWVYRNISAQNQADIINKLMDCLGDLLNEKFFHIPEISVKGKSTKNQYAKEREETQREIKKYTEILSSRNEGCLLDNIVMVMTKTNNSYQAIMSMPILVFRGIVKTITLNELRSDDNYNLAYLKNECENYKKEINNGKAEFKPTTSKGADLTGLKRLLNKK